MKVWQGEDELPGGAQGGPEVTAHLDGPELEALFDLGYHFKHVDTIFDKVFEKSAP